MATTQAIRNRLNARFDLYDGNHDGQLQREDFQGEARRVLSAFGEAESSPGGAR